MRSLRALTLAVGLGCVLLANPASHAAEDLPEIRAEGDLITIDGEPIFLKGVCYSPFIGGDAPWLGPPHNVNFQDDLAEIAGTLGANAVRVYDPLPKGFYDAARASGVWVIQGFFLPDPPNGDLLDPVYLEERKQALRGAIDQLHQDGAADVILAYVIGNGLSTQLISSAITNHQAAARYQGTYYSTPASSTLPRLDSYRGCGEPPMDAFLDPHPFQSFLAQLADAVAVHEMGQYQSRHLVGHATLPNTNPFLGARDRPAPALDVPVDLGFLDVIFENLHTYGFPYIAYYGLPDYLRRLKIHYPAKPVVVLESGYSTSPSGAPVVQPQCGQPEEPAPLTLGFGGNTEPEQAEALRARYVDVISAERPLAGFFAFEYYDEWWYDGVQLDTQNEDQPLEFFGIKSVRGTARSFEVSEKPAFSALAGLYRCDGPSADIASCGTVVIRSPTVLEATYGIPFEHTLEISGGTGPYEVEVLDPQSLPAGVTFDSATSSLRGTPERIGPHRFRLRVTDAGGDEREGVRVLRVAPPEFSTSGKDILMNGEPFYPKGVDYSPFIAGDAPWSDMTHVDPFEDMREIREVLHANTIRVYESLPKSVYDAARANGLFLIQGIHLQVNGPPPGSPECLEPDDEALAKFDYDLFDPEFFEEKKEHIINEIDEFNITGASDLVICYIVGNEVNFCAQRWTIRHHQDRPRYKGIYSVPDEPHLPEFDQYPGCPPRIDTFDDPHPFQSFVAELVDTAVLRETERYGTRHLMAHATDPNMSVAVSLKDRYFPEEHFPADLSFLDIVFQNVYSYFPPYLRFIGYAEYLEEAALAYPDTPFVILECGYSVSPDKDVAVDCAAGPTCGQKDVPATLSLCFGGNTEEQQALALARRWEEAKARPGLSAGFFAFEYYDEWWKGSERSEFVQDGDRPEEWFGIKSVTGTPEDFTIEPRPAFETVSRMFDESWCPEITCELETEGVRIRIESPGPFDSVTIRRNGEAVATLGPNELSFLDRNPSARLHTYTVTAEKAHVSCPAAECRITVPLQPEFLRGDSNADGTVNVTDPVNVLGFLFQGLATPSCLDAADANDDGQVNLADGVFTLNHLFGGGPPPADPGFEDGCGPDPTADTLAACVYPACAP